MERAQVAHGARAQNTAPPCGGVRLGQDQCQGAADHKSVEGAEGYHGGKDPNGKVTQTLALSIAIVVPALPQAACLCPLC